MLNMLNFELIGNYHVVFEAHRSEQTELIANHAGKEHNLARGLQLHCCFGTLCVWERPFIRLPVSVSVPINSAFTNPVS